MVVEATNYPDHVALGIVGIFIPAKFDPVLHLFWMPSLAPRILNLNYQTFNSIMKRSLLFFYIALLPGLSEADAQRINNNPMQWKFKSRGNIVAAPASDGSNIFIGGYDSSFYCLDSRTGKKIWEFKTGGQIGSTATIAGEKVMFFSNDAVLYCINKATGKAIWRFKAFSGALPDRRYDWPDYYQSSPTVSDQSLYFGAGDGRVYCVDINNGNYKWSFETGDVVHTKPAISNEKLVVGSFDGYMYCLNKNDGDLIWKFKTTGQRYFPKGEINGSPVIHRGKVFFGARDYNLYALDLNAGYAHWLKTFAAGWALPITPKDSVVYVGTSDDRLLLAVDAETGVIKWRQNLSFNIFGGMALDKNTGYVGTLMGKLFTIDLTNGNIKSTFEGDGYKNFRAKYFKEDDNYFVDNIGKLIVNGDAILKMYQELGAVFSQPVIVDRSIIFCSYDGNVYCLKRDE
jgi:eukaryotic-like serine/threonine-protein kinase